MVLSTGVVVNSCSEKLRFRRYMRVRALKKLFEKYLVNIRQISRNHHHYTPSAFETLNKAAAVTRDFGWVSCACIIIIIIVIVNVLRIAMYCVILLFNIIVIINAEHIIIIPHQTIVLGARKLYDDSLYSVLYFGSIRVFILSKLMKCQQFLCFHKYVPMHATLLWLGRNLYDL